MDISSSFAGRAYADAAAATRPKPQAQPGEQQTTDFGKALQRSAMETLRAVRESESTVKAGLAGRADAQSVVQALAETELAVETATTVRDRVVEAYNQILRMPV